MTKKTGKEQQPRRAPATPSLFDMARDELFSHVLRCGVADALPEHQKEWFDDTMSYIAERYNGLTEEQLGQLRTLGERFSQPVRRAEPAAAAAN